MNGWCASSGRSTVVTHRGRGRVEMLKKQSALVTNDWRQQHKFVHILIFPPFYPKRWASACCPWCPKRFYPFRFSLFQFLFTIFGLLFSTSALVLASIFYFCWSWWSPLCCVLLLLLVIVLHIWWLFFNFRLLYDCILLLFSRFTTVVFSLCLHLILIIFDCSISDDCVKEGMVFKNKGRARKVGSFAR